MGSSRTQAGHWWRGRALWALPFVAVLSAACREKLAPLEAYGTIEATEVRVASRTPGRVKTVLAQEGEAVSQGQQLAQLDLSELERERERAVASLDAAEAQLVLVTKGPRQEDIAAAHQALDTAQVEERGARREYDRLKRLVGSGAATRQEADNARTSWQVAQTQVANQGEQLRKLQRGARPEEVDAAVAARDQARASLAALDVRLEDRTLVSPIDGVVLYRLVEPDEVVAAGAPLFVLGEVRRPYLEVYVPELRVGEARPGQPVRVRVDAVSGRHFRGIVRFVASEAEFTPKNVQTAGQRARLVFRTRIDVEDPEGQLLPGMPAVAIFSGPAPTPDAGRGERGFVR